MWNIRTWQTCSTEDRARSWGSQWKIWTPILSHNRSDQHLIRKIFNVRKCYLNNTACTPLGSWKRPDREGLLWVLATLCPTSGLKYGCRREREYGCSILPNMSVIRRHSRYARVWRFRSNRCIDGQGSMHFGCEVLRFYPGTRCTHGCKRAYDCSVVSNTSVLFTHSPYARVWSFIWSKWFMHGQESVLMGCETNHQFVMFVQVITGSQGHSQAEFLYLMSARR